MGNLIIKTWTKSTNLHLVRFLNLLDLFYTLSLIKGLHQSVLPDSLVYSNFQIWAYAVVKQMVHRSGEHANCILVEDYKYKTRQVLHYLHKFCSIQTLRGFPTLYFQAITYKQLGPKLLSVLCTNEIISYMVHASSHDLMKSKHNLITRLCELWCFDKY